MDWQLNNPNLLREQCYIDGAWLSAENIAPVLNPANDDVIGQVPCMGVEQTEQAIAAASSALDMWKQKTAAERATYLMSWHDLLLEHLEDLAVIMTAEQGKPLADARGELHYAASFIKWFAEEARRINGELLPSNSADQRIMVLKQAVGVVAAITPWNFPSAMITRKVAPALAAGCTIIVKPAPDTPLSALALCALAEQAGIPSGVINCITGDAKAIGETLCQSELVRKLSFTGSTAVGKLLLAQSAQTVKKVSLELGGNAPFIVCEDADIAAAVQGAMACKFRNTGQTCVSANRFYVHTAVHDEFVAAFKQAILTLEVGDGFTEGVNQGPLINNNAFKKVSQHIEDAQQKGAHIECGAAPHDLAGNFYQPGLLTSVTENMLMMQEETFGPIAGIAVFNDDEEVITRANNTNAGLAAYVYTRDLSRSIRMSESLEYGMVAINSGILSNTIAPFGGVKESGLGREGSHHGIDDYLELKYVLLGGI